jgi:U2 small nuclear ribonucleoprotein B''
MLDGTFNMPKLAPEPAAENKPTTLQQAIFNTSNASAPGAPSGLPPKPATTLKPDTSAINAPKSPQGIKRPREEEDEDDGGEASMDEDEDEMQMDESDDE